LARPEIRAAFLATSTDSGRQVRHPAFSWTRLKPHCRDPDVGRSISARLFDPLWLIARQWQMAEFQAADAGTPVQVRLRATSALLSRCHLGELAGQHPCRH
jgi:hypothetical protein